MPDVRTYEKNFNKEIHRTNRNQNIPAIKYNKTDTNQNIKKQKSQHITVK